MLATFSILTSTGQKQTGQVAAKSVMNVQIDSKVISETL